MLTWVRDKSKKWNWDYTGEKNEIRQSVSTHPPCLCGKCLPSYFSPPTCVQCVCVCVWSFSFVIVTGDTRRNILLREIIISLPSCIARADTTAAQLTCTRQDQKASKPTTGPKPPASLALKPSGIVAIPRLEAKTMGSNGLRALLSLTTRQILAIRTSRSTNYEETQCQPALLLFDLTPSSNAMVWSHH